MPDMILHYVADHGFQPPRDFIYDVMNSEVVAGHRVQTRSMPQRIGYLSGSFPQGAVPEGFLRKLEVLMLAASVPN